MRAYKSAAVYIDMYRAVFGTVFRCKDIAWNRSLGSCYFDFFALGQVQVLFVFLGNVLFCHTLAAECRDHGLFLFLCQHFIPSIHVIQNVQIYSVFLNFSNFFNVFPNFGSKKAEAYF